MIRAAPLLLLAACNPGAPGAYDFVDAQDAVTPGLASCATAIGRPDLAVDPSAPMTEREIEALLTCTTERARR